ncbi:ricin-type beta-trefoil lectin domain protein [Streptomyces sp. NPDC002838]|uniref:ricin-type beta-trefoil lectin domain protein n=1 Tax=Streptomyces sp. NPDC002838 TaxID=3154436 RepID=UPI00332C5791
MARHWRATHDYAVICLLSSEDSASMAAAAAFHRVLSRAAGGAVRPQLLAAVRETVKEWAADDGISALLPELRKPTGGRGLRAARPVTPERRRLAERAFQALPGASQCLLWHTEVEAEPISIPAGLLGVDAATATAGLERAREQFRAGCVRAHRELAPTRECRFYNRLLDVSMRRGGALLPDVRRHLTECRYCRHAAEQLSHFEDRLDALLAETVLGWGTRRYLDSRPGRATAPKPTGTRPFVRPRTGGRHRPAAAGHLAPSRRHGRAVLMGAGLSLALLATVLVVRSWSDESGVPAPRATWGAPSGTSVSPGDKGDSSSAGSPSAASVGNAVEVGQGRLRNLVAGLCLDVRDSRLADGAGTVLAGCSSAGSQQWSYQDDGLLRSAADPTLCLDADADEGSVVIADCLVHAGEVRYDLTVRGELLLRGGKGLLVAPEKGKTAVVAERDGSEGQRWILEPVRDEPGTPQGEGPAENGPQNGSPEEPESPTAAPSSPDAETPREDPETPPDAPVVRPPQFEKRIAPADCCAEPEPAAPTEEAETLPGEAPDAAAPVTTPVHTPVTPPVTAPATKALDSGLD